MALLRSPARDDFEVAARPDLDVEARGAARLSFERVENIDPFLESRP
jgi:hypothetical protein